MRDGSFILGNVRRHGIRDMTIVHLSVSCCRMTGQWLILFQNIIPAAPDISRAGSAGTGCIFTDACEVAYRAVDIVVDDALYGANTLALHGE